jgi:Flp pilus assembly protein TadD
MSCQNDLAATQYHIAGVLAAQGKREEALKSLREAVRLRPGFWEARYLLGVELALRGDIPGAKGQFSEVVRLNPRYALAHLNLGVALANQGSSPARRGRSLLCSFAAGLN